MQTFSFVPPNMGPSEGQKNYVFVDEHNRHKRLKVMRACNGCRKRKIKCDAATTNTWPCSACTRLKLVCIPPTIGQDGDYSSHGQIPESSQQPPSLNVLRPTGLDITGHNIPHQSHLIDRTHHQPMGSVRGYNDDSRLYQAQPYLGQVQNPGHMYQGITPPHLVPLQHPQVYQHPPSQYSTSPSQPLVPSLDTSAYAKSEHSNADDLTDALGDLKIDEAGIAPYIRQQKKGDDMEMPTADEGDAKLPPLPSTSGATIRIPPELMPSEEEAMEYFDIYFTHIHPYVPVVHRSHLYQQWQTDKTSISPLLLEAIFACAGRMSDDPAQGAQWLALGNRHEMAFMEAPRLSTIQALCLLLKAREGSPKKGYFYRSWQTVKTMVSMAKDLDLHEHQSYHAENKPCGLDPVECLVQTRVWQTLLVVETMVGGPQGRTDYGVDPETVEYRTSWNIPDIDAYETERSRLYAYFVQNVRSIRLMTDAYLKIKRQADWGSDPRFMENNNLIPNWLASLPPDLQVTYPADGSAPWLPSHFVGNMHAHFYLSTIILHRPQLLASKSFAAGGKWRTHMVICYNAAKNMCRLQEAVIDSFGLNGLFYMQRGISFTVYTILTCTMLHLIAITSPDPEFNSDARMYFTRHMRLLEQCASAWPIPDTQEQINQLRLAFSADINKPFELKPSFPYGSPSDPPHPSPPMDSHYIPSSFSTSGPEQSQFAYGTHPVTPPVSSELADKSGQSLHEMALMQDHGQNPAMLNIPLVDSNSWDPTRIINQWDLAFSGGASNASSTNSPPPTSVNTSQDTQNLVSAQYGMHYSQPQKMSSMAPPQPMPQATYGNMQPVISARDWQRSVASVYDPHGLKRRWDQPSHLDQNPGMK
ncbi:hypothetical protein AJ79_03820 [Helicocarpus griseus UAMH5409]|uniref:Zn(2)-C6 fungal-type domain-containing protein n=1 Tax=Helicocarpus griseus UAMH5409 TaxID=1447875 RepID=A0A2B7XWE6_9EURO|nr:hypothetical protein AJ79_03820 [Helicocarpus griseus UAMH5409]